MADRKVLNKYYPPDYDVSKIPRLRLPRNRQIPSRIMLPMSIQCLQCGEFIYKGKKFNARKEYCEGEDYLTVKRWRFYFRCPSCLHEITFKTDPQHSDYVVEQGATRNVEPWKVRRDQEERDRLERKAADESDVMVRLENKAQDQKREVEIHELIEELKERNNLSNQFTTQQLLQIHIISKKKKEQQEDEEEAKKVFQQKQEYHQHSSMQAQESSDTVKSLDFELPQGVTDDEIDGREDDDDLDPEIRAKRKELRASGLAFATASNENHKGTDTSLSTPSSTSASTSASASASATLTHLPNVVIVKKRKGHNHESTNKKQKDKGDEEKQKADGKIITIAPPVAALSSLLNTYDSDSD